MHYSSMEKMRLPFKAGLTVFFFGIISISKTWIEKNPGNMQIMMLNTPFQKSPNIYNNRLSMGSFDKQ